MSSLLNEIWSVVVDIATNAQKLNFYRSHPNINEAQKLTISYLSSMEDGYYKNKKHLIRDAKIIYSIYAQLCRFGYYKTLPDWTMVVKKVFQSIIERLHQEEINMVIAKQGTVKECVQEIFIYDKMHYLGIDFVSAVNEYTNLLRLQPKYSTVATDIDRETILQNALDRFWLYYDPMHPDTQEVNKNDALIDSSDFISNDEIHAPWKVLLYRRFRNEEASYFAKNIICEPIDPPQNGADTPSPSPLTTSEPTTYIWLYDALRDLFITQLKSSNSRTNFNYFDCFFTDDLSACLDVSESFYLHLKDTQKLYDPTININFLNHFVAYNCATLMDAYGKPRKVVSHFVEGSSNESECSQPLDWYVFSTFLNKRKASVDNHRREYRSLLKQFKAINNITI
jgi:hypothetical protein